MERIRIKRTGGRRRLQADPYVGRLAGDHFLSPEHLEMEIPLQLDACRCDGVAAGALRTSVRPRKSIPLLPILTNACRDP